MPILSLEFKIRQVKENIYLKFGINDEKRLCNAMEIRFSHVSGYFLFSCRTFDIGG